jgi:hypothetical protein
MIGGIILGGDGLSGEDDGLVILSGTHFRLDL